MPKVSILIPTRNRPKYCEAALKSAIDQKFTDIEIIVCDNSNNDATKAVVDNYLAGYGNMISYHKNTEDIGMIGNFHKCYELANGEYINYLMDDDLFHPEKIYRMLNHFIKDAAVSLVTSYRQLIDDQNERIVDREHNRRMFDVDTVVSGMELGDILLRDLCNCVGEPTTVLFRKYDLLDKFGVYRGKQASNNIDVASWLNLLKVGKAVYISSPLSFSRVHTGQESNNLRNKLYGVADWINHVVNSRSDGFLKEDKDYCKSLSKLHAIISWLFAIMLNNAHLISDYADESLRDLCASCRLLPPIGESLLSKAISQMLSVCEKEASLDFDVSAGRIRNYLREYRRIYLSDLLGRRPVFIWGAGSHGVKSLEVLRTVGIEALGFVDKDRRKWWNKLKGITIYPEVILKQNELFPTRPCIIIGSSYVDEIKLELLEMGYVNKGDVLNIFENGDALWLI